VTRKPLDAAAALVLLRLLHEAWHEMETHRAKCPRMAELADTVAVTLAMYDARPS
jgi:hypothetical protein